MTKTKFQTVLTVFLSSALLFVSCKQSDEEFLVYDADFLLTCVQLSWKDTRAVTNDNGQGSFSSGDRIEVLITGDKKTETIQLEYMDNRWTPALKRSDYASGGFTLSALYPVLTQNVDYPYCREVSIPVGQDDIDNYAAADILFAKTTVDAANTSATLQFNHALHRININLKGSIPDDLMIEVKSLAGGKISLEDGTVTTEASQDYVWMKPYKKSEDSYSIIVLPQETKEFCSGEGLIRLTSGGKSASYVFNANEERFNAGMQTTINLTLKAEGDVDLDFSNQTYWVYGITSPVFPGKDNIPSKESWVKEMEDGLWFRYSFEDMSTPIFLEQQFLTWKEDCGWFDCNKTFEYNGDGNMCWAAAASNLIHWWMAQNKKYIEAYDKEYGPEYKDFQRPEKYSKMTKENQQHSEVFNFFKSSFDNRGSWDTGGVNWFVNGNRKNLIYCHKPDFNGFFSKVFSKEDAIAKGTTDTSKENFNLWFKDAFRHHQAIGFSVYDFAGLNTKSHSMVIWGAEFDAEGNVAYVYFCDNNYGGSEPNHASLGRYKVIYDKSNVPELKGDYAYLTPLDNTDGTPSTVRYRFTSLTLVDLRTDLWQKAFPKIK